MNTDDADSEGEGFEGSGKEDGKGVPEAADADHNWIHAIAAVFIGSNPCHLCSSVANSSSD